MSKGLSTRDLARQLGVSASTLRIWEDVLQLDIPRDEQNHRRYPVDLVETLTAIARLRQSGYDYAYIARELRLAIHEPPPADVEPLDEPAPAPEPAPVLTVEAAVPSPPEPHVRQTTLLGAAESFDLLGAYTRLSEDHRALSAKYAEATFAIGQLEERVHYLTQQLLDAETRVARIETREPPALPPPPDDAAIRDLEGQVRLLAIAMLNSRPMSLWDRLGLWWSR